MAETKSFTQSVKRLGVDDYIRQTTRILAKMPTTEEARLLSMPRNRPLIVTEGVNVDGQGSARRILPDQVRRRPGAGAGRALTVLMTRRRHQVPVPAARLAVLAIDQGQQFEPAEDLRQRRGHRNRSADAPCR